MKPHILLFLKAPRPGFVKTRLAKDVGDEKACQVYRQLVRLTLSQIPKDWPTTIFFAPEEARTEMTEWLGASYHFAPQVDGDLGDRLLQACRETLSAADENRSGVILLGGDCPYLTSEHLITAAETLATGRPVIGPCRDGGYWLLGLSELIEELFLEMPWSTAEVFPITENRLRNAGSDPLLLDTLEDIDDQRSWTSYQSWRSSL